MTLPCSAGLPDIVLRPIAPDDKASLVAGLGRLSDRSVYQRFLAPKPRLTASELRYLTEVDQVDHVALVAVLARSPRTIVGVGRWVRDAERRDQAEIAVVVADDLQGRGVGTRIGEALAEAALARGVTRFTATMLSSNAAAHRLFRKISRHLEGTRAHGADELAAGLAVA
jgi:RimJ/RimL family protein N-acetyltransferase